jgi:monoterpene epsilon-lactone hydrolase
VREKKSVAKNLGLATGSFLAEKTMNARRNHLISNLAGVLVAAELTVVWWAGCARQSTPPKAQAGPKISADKDGTIHLPAFAVPLSSYMSTKAKQTFIDQVFHPPDIDNSGPISKRREEVDKKFYQPRLERAQGLYPVNIKEEKIAGVRTDVISPRDGVSAPNHDRVLINLHGGGFQVGAGLGGLVESIPFASVGKFRVITVDYRMGPEYKFPAGSEDVAAVYKELLTQHKPQNIGIYGISAGGVLTAEAVAWFQKEKLPMPGAIGIFNASAAMHGGGDSQYISMPLNASFGLTPPPPPPEPGPPRPPSGYFRGADPGDPLVSPLVSPAVLAKFPPTLLVTGTRDFLMSGTIYSHTQLVKAGVEADLHVWEGMGHSFLVDPDTPEAQEAYDVVAKFFAKHLGSTPR